MKVTAILPENLITLVKKYTHGKNVTDAIKIALNEWLDLKRIGTLNRLVAEKPLDFEEGMTAGKIRETNRKS
jgi:hypothetical protein